MEATTSPSRLEYRHRDRDAPALALTLAEGVAAGPNGVETLDELLAIEDLPAREGDLLDALEKSIEVLRGQARGEDAGATQRERHLLANRRLVAGWWRREDSQDANLGQVVANGQGGGQLRRGGQL